MIVDISDIKLSTLRGLLGNILPELRAVCVDSKKNLIQAYFYIDGRISEELNESCESTIDQIIADFCHFQEIVFETPILQLDYAKKMPLIGEWVYYRHEESIQYVESISNICTKVTIGDLELSAQRGLLKNIFSNLRAVCVNINDHLIQFYFYHENNLSEEDRELCKYTMSQIRADFSLNRQDDKKKSICQLFVSIIQKRCL
jgi:hypothetical protein